MNKTIAWGLIFLLVFLGCSLIFFIGLSEGKIVQSKNTVLFGQAQYIEGYGKAVGLVSPCFDLCQKQGALNKACLQGCLQQNIGLWVLK